MRPDARATNWGTLLVASTLLGGCVRHAAALYPHDWAAPAEVARTSCPPLAGRYENAGELAGETPTILCGQGRHRSRGSWVCDTSLARNLADLDSAGWVELQQPDADTLVVTSSNPALAAREMHRSRGDFSCSARGVERVLHASVLSMGDDSESSPAGQAVLNGGGAVYGAVLGTGGVRTLTRRFTVAQDGSLVMDVSVSETGLVFLIPFHLKSTTFVRWRPSPTAAADSL